MEYTIDHIKEALGKKYEPGAEYVLETHRGATQRCLGGKYQAVGEIQDSTNNDSGTMVILKKVGI